MKRLSYLSAMLLPVAAFLATIVAGCGSPDKAVVSAPVRVDVKVIGDVAGTAGSRKYSGTVESADASTVSFSVPGTITKIYVEEGQKVAKGQLLAQIKGESLANSRNIAQAELDEARDAYQRLKKLHDADALPDIKWVEVQAKLRQAENAAAIADRAAGDASLYSPISGYVSAKIAGEGQTVVPAEPVLKVVSLDKLQIAISVPENEISSFAAPLSASVRFDVADSLSVKGSMSRKGVVADPLTRTYAVKFDIPNPGGRILPGMIGSVVVDATTDSVSARRTEPSLPSQAVLLAADNRQFVWTVKDGKAQRRFVIADELAADGVTVKSGLVRGDSVIVAGMQKVSAGTPVIVVK